MYEAARQTKYNKRWRAIVQHKYFYLMVLPTKFSTNTDVWREKALEFKAIVERQLAEVFSRSSGGNTTVQQLSSADELKKFKELLEAGIITQEEFDTKKKQLLGI